MPIALRLDTATGHLKRFQTGEEMLVDKIDRLAGSGNLVIGDSLGGGEELQLGSAASDVRIMGDLLVDGSETVSTNETVTGTFNANGDVNLGSGDGDTISLGGGGSDVVNLENNLVLGAGIVDIGSSVTDYLGDLWLAAVNDNGPDADAYSLVTSGTNAGAYAVGVDPTLLDNATATDLMTALDQLDAAITSASSGVDSLQDAYEEGNTIAVTTAEGAIQFSNDTDLTNTLEISRAPSSSTAGIGLSISMGANCTGDGLFVNNLGSGDAIDIQDGGSSVLQVTGAGAVNLTPTSGQNLAATAAGAGTIALQSATGAISLTSTGAAVNVSAAAASSIATSAGNLTLDSAAGELVFDDQGNSATTLSQSGDRTFDQTGSGEVLNGATSVIGAINRLARIENGVTLSVGDVVAQSATSGRCTQANGNAATNTKVIGVCAVGGTGDAGGTVYAKVALPGSKVTDTGASFTAGNALFVPDGTGRAVATAPSDTGDLVQRVGWAQSATEYIVNIGPGTIL